MTLNGIELDTKHCRKCDTTKPLSDFYRQRKRPDGKQTQCKGCSSAYRDSHRAEQKALQAAYAENPLFAKLKDGLQRARQLAVAKVESSDLLLYWEQNGISADLCYYTGERLNEDWHLDHMTPLSRGGSHTADNLVPCTPAANMAKGRRTAEEYFNPIT